MHSLLAHLTWLSMSPWQLLHRAQKTNKPLDLAPWSSVSPHYPIATTEWRGTTPQSLHSSHCNYTLWKSNSVSMGTEKGSSSATHWGEVLGVLTRNEVFREALYHKALQVTNLSLPKQNFEAGLQSCRGISWMCLSARWNMLPSGCKQAALGGKRRPSHALTPHWAPGILLSHLNICLRAGQKVAQKLLLRVNNSVSKLLASALCEGNRGFTVSYEFNIWYIHPHIPDYILPL